MNPGSSPLRKPNRTTLVGDPSFTVLNKINKYLDFREFSTKRLEIFKRILF